MPVATFRQQLADLRASLVPFSRVNGAGSFHPVIIRPALAWSMVPRPRDRPEPSAATRDEDARRREAVSAVPAGAPPAMGLVEGSKFDATSSEPLRRNGMGGLTANGGKKVEDFCRLVAEERGCFGIWTVTLPPEVALEIDGIDGGIQLLGNVIRRRFNEALARACKREEEAVRRPVGVDWCYVIEPQGSGRPHFHFVFRCKARRGRKWLLGKGQLDRLIRNAFRTVTGRCHRFAAAGNVQALRKTPGRYLSSYLKKEAARNAANVLVANGYGRNLIPSQWWGMSRSGLQLVESHRFELPSVLVGWLSSMWPDLMGAGLLDAGIWQPPNDGAPSMVVGSWRTIEKARRTIEYLAYQVEAATPTGIRFGIT